MAARIEEHQFKGKRFGRLLTVAKTTDKYPKSGAYKWKFRCDCNNILVARIADVKSGRTVSCGCLHKEIVTTHAFSQSEKLYVIWQGIKRRCHDKTHKSYERYGARGINMHRKWREDYLAFKDYVSKLPNFPQKALSKSKTLLSITLNRKDNNGNYAPGNIRWASNKEQSRNMSNNVYVVYHGRKVLLPVLCEEKGLKYNTIYGRLYRGRSIEDAIDR